MSSDIFGLLPNQIFRLLTRRMWDAFKVLERSGLPTEELRQIWRLDAHSFSRTHCISLLAHEHLVRSQPLLLELK